MSFIPKEHRQARQQDIEEGLIRSGVPRRWVHSALPDSFSAVKQWITQEGFRSQGGIVGVCVARLRPGTGYNVYRQVFDQIARGYFLRGVSIYVMPTAQLADILREDMDSPFRLDLEARDCVFLHDFYRQGMAMPYTPREAETLMTWITRRFREGRGVSLATERPILECEDWWPPGFLVQADEVNFQVTVE